MITAEKLPAAPEAERQVLGSILLLPEVLPAVRRIVGPLDFLDTANRALFGAIDLAAESGEPIVDAVLSERLRDCPEFREGGAAGFLLEIAQSVATAADVGHFAKVVREASGKRRAAELCELGRGYSLNGQPLETTLDTLAVGIDELRREFSGDQSRNEFTVAELLAEYPTLNPPVVEGIVREGEVANIISSSKSGKSWFLYGLLLSIVSGHRWLDNFNVSRGRCLLIDNELHRPTLAYRIHEVANAMGLHPADYQNDLVVISLRGKLRSLRDLADELRPLKPGEYKAIALDSKYRFATTGVSESDNSAMTLDYNLCDEISGHSKAAMFLIGHGSKGDQSGKRVTDMGSGAGAQSRACDSHLILREHEQDGVSVLDGALRSFAPIQPTPLEWKFPLWTPVYGVDPLRLKRQASPSEQRQSERDSDGMNEVEGALAFGWATSKQLQQSTGISRERVGRLLHMLIAAGRVEVKKTTIRGNDCDEFHLTQTS
jgi:hypothetical protein